MIMNPRIVNVLSSAQSTQARADVHPDAVHKRVEGSVRSRPISSPSSHRLRELLGELLGVSLHSLNTAIYNEPVHRTPDDLRNAVSLLRAQLEHACCRIRNQSDQPDHGEPLLHWADGLLKGTTELAHGIEISLADCDLGNMANEFDAIVDKLHAYQAIVLSAAEDAVDNNSDTTNNLLNTVSSNQDQPVNLSVRRIDEPQGDVTNEGDYARTRPFVLVVDADSEARIDLERTLERFGYHVIVVSNALTAIQLLQQQRLDVCMLDSHLTDMNGRDLIQEIRQSPATGQPSIIVIADAERAIAVADAIDCGADDYFEKPADGRLLHARIRSCLRRIDSTLLDLSKFLPRNVLNQVLTDERLLERPYPVDVSVMVCDVRGFSRVSERVGPVQTIGWISDVMNSLSRIILDEGGTIVDYVGDEIMAMWGAPIASPVHATKACQCAQKIHRPVAELSERWYPTIGSATRLGIGINSRLAVVGNTGSSHRVKYGRWEIPSISQVEFKEQRSTCIAQFLSRRARRVASKNLCGGAECVAFEFTILASRSVYTWATGNSNAACQAYEDALAAFEMEKHAVAQTNPCWSAAAKP